MKPRLVTFTLGLLLAALPAIAQTHPTSVTTTKRSAVTIGSGSFALVKGTKLEVVSREGDKLVVKFHSTQGKIPLADTDYPVDPVDAETAAEPAAPAPTPPPPPASPATTKPEPAKPTPPALNTSGQGQQPSTNYGKSVQKAKQASEANKSTHVDPTKGIMDEPKK